MGLRKKIVPLQNRLHNWSLRKLYDYSNKQLEEDGSDPRDDHHNEATYVISAWSAIDKGDWSYAYEILQVGRRVHPLSTAIRCELGRVLVHFDHTKRAIRLLAGVHDKKYRAPTNCVLGSALALEGRYDLAIRYLEAALGERMRRSYRSYGLYLLAFCLVRTHRDEEARAVLDKEMKRFSYDEKMTSLMAELDKREDPVQD